ncbi:MAG: bifunctional phosphoribosyl-AMP cyclohydrolase/phosphoribosyl-ATP diphosphatase [Bacteroidetes bacterium HGW-Bacteroidetes-4]|jgi:phosphoribosyl-ATP pyrophosphohydrolase/phosphoribosyl-AMP cyclohydrolase|nr:MAG: bifunctional phosphoribosyl-AMP cyclohydrolase/phosphoribosyl-ATP diphosphatase [Bacteroidetes bacterium HGW-Bacteroidetes-4]
MKTIDFKKYSDGLVPAIVQDAITNRVLMLGFMNEQALSKTRDSGKVTFYSRSQQKIWTKGETSGNFLFLKQILIDCDNDTLLIKVNPQGPTCHKGTDTCFNEVNQNEFSLQYLENVITMRREESPEVSYTRRLFDKGINKIAQKVGEEAVELIIEAKDNNKELFINEAADLMYHYIVLLKAKGFCLDDVITVLKERHKK